MSGAVQDKPMSQIQLPPEESETVSFDADEYQQFSESLNVLLDSLYGNQKYARHIAELTALRDEMEEQAQCK